jgi:Cys-tRNA synthase (O-phospho-L-seryl-tRNA:Cys-tRNA synthase)
MYQVIYRFKDSKGKTRKTALVTYHDDHYISTITGTASEYQVFAAIDGAADSVGKLTISSQYVGE